MLEYAALLEEVHSAVEAMAWLESALARQPLFTPALFMHGCRLAMPAE